MRKLSSKDDMQHEDIQKMLQLIPEFERKQTEVLIHLDLSKMVSGFITGAEYNVMKLIEFEQSLISGVNERGEPEQEMKLAKELTKLVKTLKRP